MQDHPEAGAEPRGLFDSDPEAVREIIQLEHAIMESYNTTFLQDPAAPLEFYEQGDDLYYYELWTPSEYKGDQVRKFYEWMGPQFTGRVELREIKVFAKGEAGFVVMKQHYSATDGDGNPIEMEMRQTDGVVKRDGKWKVAHTHISFPARMSDMTIDMMSAPLPMPWDEPAVPS
jgi:ketosteroid isomerase-like protein